MSGAAPTQPLCVVSPHESGGGAEYQIQCLLDTLAARGHRELYFLAHHPDAEASTTHYRLLRIGRGQRMPRFGYLMDAVPLYRALCQIRPAAIYQRVACGYTGLSALYARLHGARLVWHVASDNDVSVKSAFGDRNPVRRWLEKRSVVYGLRHAHCVVTQTHAQSVLMRANYGRKADAIVPNFHPQPAETIDKSGPVTVVWISNLKPLKRPELFIRLARALQDLPQVHFLMIGAAAGYPRWIAELQAAVAATPNLQYLGQRPQGEVNAILARSHLLVNTSTREGFPNTFIQSWMRGVPVVSLNVDPDGVLEGERVGVHAGGEERMVAAVRQLTTDAALRAGYAERAAAYALRAHSMSNAETLARLLEEDYVNAAVRQ